MSTRSNMRGTTRAAVGFTVTIASGTAYSSAFSYEMSDFALGDVTPSGTIPATGHIGLQSQDYWYNWVPVRSWDSGYTKVTIQSPTGNQKHPMPPDWFGVVGSARLWYTDGSGSGILPTANCTFSVGLKS